MGLRLHLKANFIGRLDLFRAYEYISTRGHHYHPDREIVLRFLLSVVMIYGLVLKFVWVLLLLSISSIL